MRIETTGFLASDAGSVASANAMILREFVARGILIDFFSKPSFVDPRPIVEMLVNRSNLKHIDCTNRLFDGLRRRLWPSGNGIPGQLLGFLDATTYNCTLVKKMRLVRGGDLDLWLGDWSRGAGTRPVVSFVQGPPGTDATSVARHKDLIVRLAGKSFFLKLWLFANYRLTVGLPNFSLNDRIVVGSEWSRSRLSDRFGVSLSRTVAVPYPIDLELFRPFCRSRSKLGPIKLLWLGRFAPRKRLDLFLKGIETAITAGCDVVASIVGQSDFVPNYESLIRDFPFPERITHTKRVSRVDVPALMWEHDVLCQPSDDENFGSSVAEAMACGIPAIVGATNGTGDYICDRSIRLRDESVEGLAQAIDDMEQAKRHGTLTDVVPSRRAAEEQFAVERVVDRLFQAFTMLCNG